MIDITQYFNNHSHKMVPHFLSFSYPTIQIKGHITGMVTHVFTKEKFDGNDSAAFSLALAAPLWEHRQMR